MIQRWQSQAGAGLTQTPGESYPSFLQVHLGLAGRGIYGKRDVRVEQLPLTVDLMPAVGHPKSCLSGFAVLVRPGEMLKAAGDAHPSVGDDVEGDELTLGVLGGVEEIVESRRARPSRLRIGVVGHNRRARCSFRPRRP